MILPVYQIKDDLSGKMYFPFIHDNDQTAMRMFVAFCKCQKVDCSDFILTKYGTYDTNVGLITNGNERTVLMFGRECFDEGGHEYEEDA